MPVLTRAQRKQQTQSNKEPIPEVPLRIDIDNAPDNDFRDQQQQEQDEQSQLLDQVLSAHVLDDDEINGKERILFSKYSGDQNIEDLKKAIETDSYYIDRLLEKYPHRNSLQLLGNLSLKAIFSTFQPDNIGEAAFIINCIRKGFKDLWINFIKKQIKIKKWKVNEIRKILKKNKISTVDENKKKLSINKLKKLMYNNQHINIYVLEVEPPSSARNNTRINYNEQNNDEQSQSQTDEPSSQSQSQQEPFEILIEINKQNKEKFRKIVRSDMMKLLKEDEETIIELLKLIDLITTNLDQQALIDTCQTYDRVRNYLKKLSENLKKETQYYKAAPRYTKSRYVNRPELITDLDKRIKHYNNQKQQLLKLAWLLSSQTRSPMMIGMASGPSFGVTKSSKGILWCSAPMQYASLETCYDFQTGWTNFLEEQYLPQRVEIQNDYKYIALLKKIKQIVKEAEIHKLDVILNKCKEVDLGHLLTEMQEQNISCNFEVEDQENDNDNDGDTDMEQSG